MGSGNMFVTTDMLSAPRTPAYHTAVIEMGTLKYSWEKSFCSLVLWGPGFAFILGAGEGRFFTTPHLRWALERMGLRCPLPVRVCGLGIVLRMITVSLMASVEIEVSQTLSRPLACLLLMVPREFPAKILSGPRCFTVPFSPDLIAAPLGPMKQWAWVKGQALMTSLAQGSWAV